jgi:hypothetical protein
MPETSRPQTVEDLIPDEQNANRETERGAELLEYALRNVGAGRSILIDKYNRIIAGNKTAEAAVNAGLIKLRVVETNGQELVAVKRTDVDLDTPTGRQMALGDNLIGLRGLDLDVEVIVRQAHEHNLAMEQVGLSEKEMAQLLKAAAIEQAAEGGGESADSIQVFSEGADTTLFELVPVAVDPKHAAASLKPDRMLLTADSNTAAALKKAGLTCFPMNLRGAKVYKGAF